ncbi:transposable element Tcb2 transposase [Trichonephila clavipes]|uniref:Transposable element Tcb2 transposase n=1 Tax=Trichonephila clavipes TaxID=2585209 RepID=A0A8X6W8Q7_TRICX|nr:transposable element Tcb2 transposase [Trichonephila clavipes]
MEAGWSAMLVARQLGRSDCVVKRFWDQWIREMSFTRRPDSERPLPTSHREDHHIVRNARVQQTASSAVTQAQVVFSDESRFNLSSDDNRVRVARPRGELLNPAFALQLHTAPTAGVMASVSQDCLRTVTTLLWPADPQICLQSSISGIIWEARGASLEFERTRGMVTANMERNVSIYHTELVCLNARSYRIVHSRYSGFNRRFVEWAPVVPDFHKRILFSDEAHFWLNGYVSKQNCRIWSEANPQVYVETPLHPEKLTVWCALWAGGIIGPYFFKNDEGHNVTVNGDRYRAMITNFLIPELNNHDVQEL